MASTPILAALAAAAAFSVLAAPAAPVARSLPSSASSSSPSGPARGVDSQTPRSKGVRADVPPELDQIVRTFLDGHKSDWQDLNVPAVDGQTLHDLIVKHKYTRALEIGTSTGHSGIWIAWALSKTGGRLTTIEIDPGRREQALANFKAAGLAHVIDSRLADAHELTKTIEGPFDFVFSDADKDWYANYLTAIWPKLTPGGCFTAHNVSMRGGGIGEFLDKLNALPDGTTTIDRSSSAGLSITYKRAR
jgi:caffeoyl-CoA O-methyltransferase